MKVLRVVSSMNPKFGGVVEAIDSTAKMFDGRMEVVCFDRSTDRWLQNNKYTVHALNGSFTLYSINIRYLYWLWRNARNYDVVILDGLWQFFSLGWIVLFTLKVPYCVFTHGMLDPYFNKKRLKFIKKLPFWFLIERWSLRFATRVIFTCEEESLLARKSFPFTDFKKVTCSLGVASNDCNDRVIKGVDSDAQILLFLSRVHPKKGIDTLINAVSELKEEIANDVKFVIVGPGSKDYKEQLKLLAENLTVENYFHWVDMLSGEEKWSAYNRADAFILPSHQENFGIVIPEAMSKGVPIITTSKVNIWREIESDGAAIVSEDTIQGVKSSLKKWFELEDDQRLLMKENSMKSYQSRYCNHAAKKNMERVINLCLK